MEPHAPETPTAERPPCGSQRTVLLIVSLLAAAGIIVLWLVDPVKAHIPLCAFHAMTGMHCPGCGATRATHALLHGHWLEALQDNALWTGLLPLALYAGASEMRRWWSGHPLPGDLLRKTWLYVGLIPLGLLFFVLRNLPGWPWELLRPPG